MPTYVYQCSQCSNRFEAQQHMTDDPLTMCPQCGGSIHRVLFPAGIVFRGSGFYSTDHRPTPAGNASPSAGASAASVESGASTESSTSTSESSSTPSSGEAKPSDKVPATKK